MRSKCIVENFFSAGFSAPVVAGYWPVRGEVDDLEILRRSHESALPCIEGDRLVFRRWQEGQALEDGPFNIPAPARDAAVVVPDLILVPLVAFDRRGHRLGYGGGFYDRVLAQMPVRAIGLAYATQVCDEVPILDTDRRLDAVVTDTDVLIF